MMEHNSRTSESTWNPREPEISMPLMLRRIRTTIANRPWRHIVKKLEERGLQAGRLRVAEVGCGTGTAALTFGLLGAAVTLIDSNAKALDRARRIYSGFGCPAEFILADCLERAPGELEGAFDLVLSSGLAEHFTGGYRQRCVDYHRTLLNPGGMAVIGVPNRLSPFYQWLRSFRVMTGTWNIDVEIPFTNGELMYLAGRAGFRDHYVMGSAPLMQDLAVYSRGLVSAAADLMPSAVRESARSWKNRAEDKTSSVPDPGGCAARLCREAQISAIKTGPSRPCSAVSGWLSSGLNLVGFR